MQRKEFLIIFAATVACIYATHSHADGEQFYFGLFDTSKESYVSGLSALGTAAVGTYKMPGTRENTGTLEGYQAYLWTNSGSKKLGFLAGGEFSEANAISADGTTVVGSSDSATGTQAFRWTTNGGMQGLGYLSTTFQGSRATGVSGDGSFVVGYSRAPNNNGSAITEAFIWSEKMGMVGLGYLGDPIMDSLAYAISDDGKTVVGESALQAFKWTQSTGMIGLGFLPAYGQSLANDVSADGSVIVGEALRGSGTSQAFRWTESSGMQGLGFLQNSNSSRALAVSGNGKVIVGESILRNGDEAAFRWTESGGMESIKAWLSKNGVNYSGALSTARSTNHDGSVVVGDGYSSTGRQPWLARVGGDAIGSGILTDINAFNSSLAQTAIQSIQVSASLASLTLNGAHHRSILDSGLARSFNGLCTWATTDAYSQNLGKSRIELAEVGLCKDIGNSRYAIGAGIIESKQDFSSGNIIVKGQYLLAEAATILAGGVQPSALLYLGTNSADIKRKYLNGSTVVASSGTPDTTSASLRLRLDWKDVLSISDIKLSPYTSLTWTESQMDGYTENGGGFPATYSNSRMHSNDFRLGLAAKKAISPDTDIRLAGEIAHRTEDTGGNIKVQVIGLFSFDLLPQTISQNIARIIMDVDHRFSDKSLLTFSLITANSQGETNWGLSGGYRAAF